MRLPEAFDGGGALRAQVLEGKVGEIGALALKIALDQGGNVQQPGGGFEGRAGVGAGLGGRGDEGHRAGDGDHGAVGPAQPGDLVLAVAGDAGEGGPAVGGDHQAAGGRHDDHQRGAGGRGREQEQDQQQDCDEARHSV